MKVDPIHPQPSYLPAPLLNGPSSHGHRRATRICGLCWLGRAWRKDREWSSGNDTGPGPLSLSPFIWCPGGTIFWIRPFSSVWSSWGTSFEPCYQPRARKAWRTTSRQRKWLPGASKRLLMNHSEALLGVLNPRFSIPVLIPVKSSDVIAILKPFSSTVGTFWL